MESGKVNLNKMTSKELIVEIERLNGEIEKKDTEINRLKYDYERLEAMGKEVDERFKLRKDAADIMEKALKQSEDIIKQARDTAEKIIANAKEASKNMNVGKPEFVLPGSKGLVIGDELLKNRGKGNQSAVCGYEDDASAEVKVDRIIDEYLGDFIKK